MTTELGVAPDGDSLVEELAAIEHERWADWQRWVQRGKAWQVREDTPALVRVPGEPEPRRAVIPAGALVLPPDDVARWDRQITTPYADLTQREKESDRAQVRRHLPVFVRRAAAWHAAYVLREIDAGEWCGADAAMADHYADGADDALEAVLGDHAREAWRLGMEQAIGALIERGASVAAARETVLGPTGACAHEWTALESAPDVPRRTCRRCGKREWLPLDDPKWAAWEATR